VPPTETLPALDRAGSFAPRLDAAGVDRYRALAADAPPAVRDAMLPLCDAVAAYLGVGDRAAGRAVPHPCGYGLIKKLPGDALESLDPHVPWPRELAALAEAFDGIDPAADKPLRDAAYHLLWYATELSLDRHPITADTIEL
jgi:hypothetical protein